ncbi:MAG: type I asparaginase, partial [Bacteroidales bacterium]
AVPSLKALDIDITAHCFEQLIDSSDMGPEGWIEIAEVIEKNYTVYDGFVVLHGTDTMAYTASAMSFMLQNLTKPVIFTGSQLPIGVLRSDGKDNLINAFEMAATVDEKEKPMVPEVCVCFENKLYRGNRITKQSAEYFNAFVSGNYPSLAKLGVHIKWHRHLILSNRDCLPFKVNKRICQDILLVKIYPGMTEDTLKALVSIPNLKGIVLESYGSGNAPTVAWFSKLLAQAIARGILIINVTQCVEGSVEMGKYAASTALKEIGVINGYDITTESALTKMMMLLGQNTSQQEKIDSLTQSICGEMSSDASNLFIE